MAKFALADASPLSSGAAEYQIEYLPQSPSRANHSGLNYQQSYAAENDETEQDERKEEAVYEDSYSEASTIAACGRRTSRLPKKTTPP